MTVHIQHEITIDAPRARVWEILADLESVQDYDAAIVKAFCLTEQRSGIGASRQCDLPNGEYIRERVVNWQEGVSYTIGVYEDVKDSPFDNQFASFALSDVEHGQTLVVMTYTYEVKSGGPAGAMEQEAHELVTHILEGLKRLVETGESAAA